MFMKKDFVEGAKAATPIILGKIKTTKADINMLNMFEKIAYPEFTIKLFRRLFISTLLTKSHRLY